MTCFRSLFSFPRRFCNPYTWTDPMTLIAVWLILRSVSIVRLSDYGHFRSTYKWMIYNFYFTIIITACTNYFKGLLNTKKGINSGEKKCKNLHWRSVASPESKTGSDCDWTSEDMKHIHFCSPQPCDYAGWLAAWPGKSWGNDERKTVFQAKPQVKNRIQLQISFIQVCTLSNLVLCLSVA